MIKRIHFVAVPLLRCCCRPYTFALPPPEERLVNTIFFEGRKTFFPEKKQEVSRRASWFHAGGLWVCGEWKAAKSFDIRRQHSDKERYANEG
jgi:hypothetical protein